MWFLTKRLYGFVSSDQNKGWIVLYLITSRGVVALFFGSHSLKSRASCAKTSYGQSVMETKSNNRRTPGSLMLAPLSTISLLTSILVPSVFLENEPLRMRLLTNTERARRGLAEDPSCPICGPPSEDILHVIRDCTLAKEVWKQVNPSSHGAEANWACLFGLLAWRLWKNRNLFIFQEKSWSPEEIIKTSVSWAKHFSLTSRHVADVEIETTRGQLLEGEWTYLNTDGAVRVDSGAAAAGGVLRDKNVEWILGYNKYLGNCSTLDAEL
ncbi:Non-LTR retroelement reverse transcriptase [Gossypium australe]|uniref:Non-LTR retroelement reverse transcriptase n=1 Tax=Gossypium australe TaxID=47621 RepID=A0A5B6X9Y6_9ROSI|nr:Non-LTR retroelement reverse transcriptase [Gossypium australe]